MTTHSGSMEVVDATRDLATPCEDAPPGQAVGSAPRLIDVETPRRLSDRAYDYIVSNIANGNYPPDSRVVEREVAEALGTSNVPVREAMERLEQEGWIKRIPRKGARVIRMDLESVRMLCQVREILECGIVRIVAENHTEQQIAVLRASVERMERAFEEIDSDAYFEADSAFHRDLARLTGNPRLATIHGTIYRQFCMAIPKFMFEAVNKTSTRKRKLEHIEPVRHRAILEAVEQGNVPLAEQRMRMHLGGSYRMAKALEDFQRALTEVMD